LLINLFGQKFCLQTGLNIHVEIIQTNEIKQQFCAKPLKQVGTLYVQMQVPLHDAILYERIL